MALVGNNNRKVWHAICDRKILSHIFIKQQSRDCIKFWRRVNPHSSLKHLVINIQNIIIMLWVEEFQEMVHLIIINWFYWSGVWIWNIFRVRFRWKIWKVNLNIKMINVTVINLPHNSWNHRTGFERRGPGFELRWWILAVPLPWWISWFITMKSVELINLSYKAWWEEYRSTKDAGIILV